jgi:FKBP-type peptidyl-prolyl cis-trans isomerase SlpA
MTTQHHPQTDITEPPRVHPGAKVCLHLALHLEDGTEVLSTFDNEPLALTLGDGTLAPGLESLLVGLAVGTDTEVLAEGEAVYGAHDPALVHDLPRSDLPTGFAPTVGQVIAFGTPGGQETPGTVLAVAGEQVKVDFNHPLARRWLRVRIQLLSVD